MAVNKTDIDLLTAEELGVKVSTVAKITRSFLGQIRHGLVQEGEVILAGLGTLRVIEVHSKVCTNLVEGTLKRGVQLGTIVLKDLVQLRVGFIKGHALRVDLKKRLQMNTKNEEGMEKYAVSEQVDQAELEKRAAQGCPNCGRTPQRHGQTLICPSCGSAPFEG